MLPTFEATFHGEQLILMNRPFQLGFSQILILKSNRMFFLHQHTSYCKPTCVGVYPKWFGKVRKLKKGEVNFVFSTSQMSFLAPLAIWMTFPFWGGQWGVWPMPKIPLWTYCRNLLILKRIKVLYPSLDFAIPWWLRPFLDLALCLSGTTHVPRSPFPFGQIHYLFC